MAQGGKALLILWIANARRLQPFLPGPPSSSLSAQRREGMAGSDLSAEERGFACSIPDSVVLHPASLFLCTEAQAALAGQCGGVPDRGVPSRKGVWLFLIL